MGKLKSSTLKGLIREKRKQTGQAIELNSKYTKQVVQATKNIEGQLFNHLQELGQRARMAQVLTVIVEKLEDNDFSVGWFKNKESFYISVDLQNLRKELNVDSENSWLITEWMEDVFKKGMKINLKDKLETINEYLEEQLNEEVLPGVTLQMLVDEQLMMDT
jgi:hypothetical protein